MKFSVMVLLTILLSGVHSRCYALRCNCDDWVEKGGYCVDYIKDRIPAFAIPTKDDMVRLKNTRVSDVTEGDVAIFTVKNYWHVAYVEKVHRSSRGEASAIDVSEMNFGGELSFAEFKDRWRSNSKAEWTRAACCGITDTYDEVTLRKNVPMSTVKQVWSPDGAGFDDARRRVRALFGQVREVIDRLVDPTSENSSRHIFFPSMN